MKNQLSTVTEVVVRSIFYIITNYVFVAWDCRFILIGLQFYFYFQWYGLLLTTASL